MILRRHRKKRKDFENRILNHLDPLYFGALKLTGHREDAEDLVQETYHKAFNHISQLRDLEKSRLWLYRIMVNTWKNWRRKRSREFFPDDPEQWEVSMNQSAGGHRHSHSIDPETDLMNKELWEAVESALAHLPPNYRMALILADIEGFSYKEISDIMAWPAGTVMSRLSRARSLLGRHLTGYREATREGDNDQNRNKTKGILSFS